jgi:CHAT domain-containing protein
MNAHISQPMSSDQQLAERLITVSGGDEWNQLMRERGELIPASVIRQLKDEVARLIRTDIARAVTLAALTRRAAEHCADPAGAALACHASALAMHFSGRYTEALDEYQQAETVYAQLGQEVEAARIIRAKVDVLMYLSEYERALQAAARARDIFQNHGEMILLAQLESNVGNIFHRLDKYGDALKYYETAEEIFAAHHDETGLAFTKFNRANQCACLNRFEQALALYREAQQIYERLDNPLLVNSAEYSIAWVYFQRGQFQDSLRLLAKVRSRAQELGDVSLDALCDLDLSEVYLQVNAYEDALESARAAVKKFETLGMSYEHYKAKMYLGIAYTHWNDPAAAARELQEARRGFLTEGNEVFTAMCDIYLSNVFTRERNWPQARQCSDEARQIFVEQGLSAKAAYAELQLARLTLAEADADQARQLCQSALLATETAESPWLRHQCFHLLGNVMEQAGDDDQAYRYYAQAVEHLENLRSRIWLDEYKCTFVKDKLRVYEDLVDLCLRAGTAEKVEEALSYAEAAKSRALVDLLVADRRIESKLHQANNGAAHRDGQALREQLDWLYNRISQYESRAGGRPDRLVYQLRQEAHRCERMLAKVIRRINIEDPEYTSLQTVSRLDTQALCQSLAEDEVLVEYYIVNNQVKLFLVSRDGVRVFNDLTTVNATAPLLRRLKFYLEKFTLSQEYINAHQSDFQTLTNQSLRLLYIQLVEPVAPLLEGKKIIFIPHGVLHYVPFHALYDGREYLIDRHEISYSPSATVFTLCLEKARRQRRSDQVLIMGVPDEAAPLIRDEVEAVRSLWPDAQVFLDHEATLDRLREQAPQCRLLHLASHGVFRRDNPMFSALKLSDCWLNLYDIFNLDLNAELVTLSVCETGMNAVFPGDELFGLMRGFLYAGAPSLVVSLWVAHDGSTSEFMRWFYAGMREGLSKRAAYRQAQRAVREEYAHPYYWAPFILMGDPS